MLWEPQGEDSFTNKTISTTQFGTLLLFGLKFSRIQISKTFRMKDMKGVHGPHQGLKFK